MYPTSLFILLFSLASVHADLTCLAWLPILRRVGQICVLEHETHDAVESATIQAVEATAKGIANKAEFAVTHNRVSLAFTLANTGDTEGTDGGNLKRSHRDTDVVDVEIEIGEGLVNQGVAILELPFWNDVIFCILDNAAQTTIDESDDFADPILALRSRHKRADPHVLDKRVELVRSCLKPFLLPGKPISRMAYFNTTGKNQKIGGTLAQIASSLVLVHEEGKAADPFAKINLDLAMSGRKGAEGLRIYKAGAAGAEHFATEKEGYAVKQSLRDPAWNKDNCKACAPPGSAINGGKHRSIRGTSPLLRRGAISDMLNICCGDPPETVEPLLAGLETSSDPVYNPPAAPAVPLTRYNPDKYWKLDKIPEDQLLPSPPLTPFDARTDRDHILDDLEKHHTARVKWFPRLRTIKNLESSRAVFKTLREMFEQSTEAGKAAHKELLVIEPQPHRHISDSMEWIVNDIRDPGAKTIQAWSKAVIDEAIAAVEAFGGDVLTKDQTMDLSGSVEFFYHEPGKWSESVLDERGVHTDYGIIQFGAADIPGVVIETGGVGSFSRLDLVDDTFYLIGGTEWEGPGRKLAHAVFGPKVAETGRVSMIINIWQWFGKTKPYITV